MKHNWQKIENKNAKVKVERRPNLIENAKHKGQRVKGPGSP